MNEFPQTHSLGESHRGFCPCSSFIVWYCHALLSRMSSARTPAFQTTPPSLLILLTTLLTMPSPSCQFFFKATTQAIQYGRRLACIIVTQTLAWVQANAVQVTLDLVEQTCQLAVKEAARCIFVFFHFGSVDIYKGERGGRDLHAQLLRQHRRQVHPHTTCFGGYCVGLGRGHLSWPCDPLVGPSSKSFLFFFV